MSDLHLIGLKGSLETNSMVLRHSVGGWGSTDLGNIKIGHFIFLAVEEDFHAWRFILNDSCLVGSCWGNNSQIMDV